MEFISRPRVYLVGRQNVDTSNLDMFLSDRGVEQWETDAVFGGDKLIETAGRICYMSFAKPRPGGNKAYIDHIIEVGHGSVIEHAVYGLIISGVSRSLTHELVRHRVGMSPSQMSQRYVDESDCNFVVPPAIENDPEALGVWMKHMQASQEAYKSLYEILDKKHAVNDRTTRRKICREAARSVLPAATETIIYVTANARALRHFLELRGSLGADREIRRLAVEMLRVLQAESWALFSDYTIHDDDSAAGSWIEVGPHTKI